MSKQSDINTVSHASGQANKVQSSGSARSSTLLSLSACFFGGLSFLSGCVFNREADPRFFLLEKEKSCIPELSDVLQISKDVPLTPQHPVYQLIKDMGAREYTKQRALNILRDVAKSDFGSISQFISHPDSTLRANAATAIAELSLVGGKNTLYEAFLVENDKKAKYAIAEGLLKLGHCDINDHLIDSLSVGSQDYFNLIHPLLQNVSSDQLDRLIGLLAESTLSERILSNIAELPLELAIPRLRVASSSCSIGVARAAQFLLGYFGEPEGRDLLIDNLDSPDFKKELAFQGMLKFKDKESVEIVESVLQTQDVFSRDTLIYHIIHLPNPSLVPALRNIFNSTDCNNTKRLTALALFSCGDPSIREEALVEVSSHSPTWLDGAVMVVGKHSDEASISILIDKLDSAARVRAFDCLTDIGAPAIPILKQRLKGAEGCRAAMISTALIYLGEEVSPVPIAKYIVNGDNADSCMYYFVQALSACAPDLAVSKIFVSALLEKNGDLSHTLKRGIEALSSSIVGPLIQIAMSRSEEKSSRAIECLKGVGAETSERLGDLCIEYGSNRDDDHFRLLALFGEDAVPYFRRLLLHENSSVRLKAEMFFPIEVGISSVYPELMYLKDSADLMARESGYRLLCKANDEATINSILSKFRESPSTLSEEEVIGISHSSSSEAVSAVRELMKSEIFRPVLVREICRRELYCQIPALIDYLTYGLDNIPSFSPDETLRIITGFLITRTPEVFPTEAIYSVLTLCLDPRIEKDPALLNAQKTFVSTLSGRALCIQACLDTLRDERKKIYHQAATDILERYKEAEKYNILFPFRYSEPVWKLVKAGLSAPPLAGEQVAVFFYNREDRNGAFNSSNEFLQSIYQQGVRVEVYEVSSLPELLDAARKARFNSDGTERSIVIAGIAGHGHENGSIRLGPQTGNDNNLLSLRDQDVLSKTGFFHSLAPSSSFIFNVCYSGNGFKNGANLANMVRSLAGERIRPNGVWSTAELGYGIEEIHFEKDPKTGRVIITNIIFNLQPHVRVYQAKLDLNDFTLGSLNLSAG